MNIKKNDKIYIIKGKDKGKSATVLNVLSKENKLVASGVFVYKKHLKPNARNPHGGLIDKSMPIRRENIALICPRCEKITRIGYLKSTDSKVRICKKCHESVENI